MWRCGGVVVWWCGGVVPVDVMQREACEESLKISQ